MSTLVIVESPAKAKTIEKYLGTGYIVRSSIGHVRDLPKSNKDAVDIPAGFVPKYIITPGKEKIIRELRSIAKKSDAVLLAADPDREGEAIAWHVAELLQDVTKNLKRITFNEITKEAVQAALGSPRAIDMNLKAAQEARRVLDRLVGYDLSGIIWKKVRYGLSAGRVQSPALRILMERERLIRAFVPEEYFILTAHTETEKNAPLSLVCIDEPRDKDEATRIEKLSRKYPWHVVNIQETEAKRTPYPPFITSTLQQVASTRLGFSPSRTMRAAQKLYEGGHITYMRTDSPNLSSAAQGATIGYVREHFGDTYLQPRSYKASSKSAQEAHEAIRPTSISKEVAGSSDDERLLYALIRTRTIASQMSDARAKRTKILANIKGDSKESIPDFAINGSRLLFDGWLKVDPAARGEDTEVPLVHVGENLSLREFTVESKFTEPPKRYTEAGLIKELEKRGIGRPSTYASILQTLTDRDYVTKQARTLIPTDTGDVVSTFLETHFAPYISDTFTSEMEQELDEIAEGDREYVKTLADFYTPFTKAIEEKEHIEKATNLGDADPEFTCPDCHGPMVIKLGKNGKFLSCANYPECTGARLIDGSIIKENEPIGTHPETGESIYLLSGRFGPYVQLGEIPPKERGKKQIMPRRASVPTGMKVANVTTEDAVKYLSLPRDLGVHPETGEHVTASTGRFGPYLAHAGEFRSLKGADDPYTISYERALEILATPKPGRKGEKEVKDLGLHPKTKRPVKVYESKSGKYLRKGLRKISIADTVDMDAFTIEDAVALLGDTVKKTKKKK